MTSVVHMVDSGLHFADSQIVMRSMRVVMPFNVNASNSHFQLLLLSNWLKFNHDSS